jgi:hypothetical protein
MEILRTKKTVFLPHASALSDEEIKQVIQAGFIVVVTENLGSQLPPNVEQSEDYEINWESVGTTLQNEMNFKKLSVTAYLSRINRILKKAFPDVVHASTAHLKDFAPIIEYIASDSVILTQKKGLCNAIRQVCSALKLVVPQYDDYFQKTITIDRNARCNAEITPKESSEMNLIDFDKMKNQVKTLPIGRRRIITALYSMLPPLRGGEYLQTEIFEKVNEEITTYNYVDLNQKVLVVNDHKTVSHNGQKQITLPDELVEEIKLHFKAGNNVLLDMTTTAFSKWMMRNFGFGSQSLRKAYVIRHFPTLTGNEKNELAVIMGHCAITQMIDYNKSEPTA